MRGGAPGAKEGARRAAREARPWIERMARFGYAAYGVVYVLVGALSVRTAFGGGGKTAGQEGALQSILLAPFGSVLLGLVALGLLGYAAWRLFQGALEQPFGRLLVGAVGVVIFATGLFQSYRAYDAKFMEKLKPGEMSPRERK